MFATTNMPWEMDIAALRRFERKILVPMPNMETRIQILKLHAGKQHYLIDSDWQFIAKKTEGYSGSDLSTLVNDGLMRPIKEIFNSTHFKKVQTQELLDKGLVEREELQEDNEGYAWMPVNTDPKSEDFDAELVAQGEIKKIDLVQISEKHIFVRKANLKDFKQSILNCKPTVNTCFLELYARFL